jgi:hypothetical protein
MALIDEENPCFSKDLFPCILTRLMRIKETSTFFYIARQRPEVTLQMLVRN